MGMSSDESDEREDRFKNHPILGKALRFLQRYRAEINAHSDGWGYWKSATGAAEKLMDLLYLYTKPEPWPAPPPLTEAMVKKTLTPIKTFCTKNADKGIKFPMYDEPPPVK